MRGAGLALAILVVGLVLIPAASAGHLHRTDLGPYPGPVENHPDKDDALALYNGMMRMTTDAAACAAGWTRPVEEQSGACPEHPVTTTTDLVTYASQPQQVAADAHARVSAVRFGHGMLGAQWTSANYYAVWYYCETPDACTVMITNNVNGIVAYAQQFTLDTISHFADGAPLLVGHVVQVFVLDPLNSVLRAVNYAHDHHVNPLLNDTIPAVPEAQPGPEAAQGTPRTNVPSPQSVAKSGDEAAGAILASLVDDAPAEEAAARADRASVPIYTKSPPPAPSVESPERDDDVQVSLPAAPSDSGVKPAQETAKPATDAASTRAATESGEAAAAQPASTHRIPDTVTYFPKFPADDTQGEPPAPRLPVTGRQPTRALTFAPAAAQMRVAGTSDATPAWQRTSGLATMLMQPAILAPLLSAATLLMGAMFYSRLSRKAITDQEARENILERIRTHPGETSAGIGRAVNLHRTTVRYHLSVLLRENLVAERVNGIRRHYFIPGTPEIHALGALVAQQAEPARKIMEAATARPGIGIREACEAAGVHRITVHYHVKNLLAAGVLRAERTGRALKLFPA